jgi:hypothetical protein
MDSQQWLKVARAALVEIAINSAKVGIAINIALAGRLLLID